MEPLVSIDFMTYNNAPYIKDALDGFLMQKINFPVEICVYDDGSTDGTQDILREYEKNDPGIFNIMYQKENQANKGVDVFREYQLPRLRGKYIAVCKPYDYWFHKARLDLAAKYLETHKNCSCVFHPMVIRDETQKGYILGIDQVWAIAKELYADDFMSPSPFTFSESSMTYRADMVKDWAAFRQADDIEAETLKYQLISRGYFNYFPDIMGVRRLGAQGAPELKLDTDADFAVNHHLTAFKWLSEFNAYTKGEYVVLIGANIQSHIEALNELNAIQNFPWLLDILVQTEDKIKNLEEIKEEADAAKSKKSAKKYKIAQKEYWKWFVNAIGEGAKK